MLKKFGNLEKYTQNTTTEHEESNTFPASGPSVSTHALVPSSGSTPSPPTPALVPPPLIHSNTSPAIMETNTNVIE